VANEIPWIDVPFVRQIRAGCGSAAIAMVMQYWVKHGPGMDAAAADAERIDDALPPSSKGLSGKELRNYLEEHGFDAYVFNAELKDLRDHLSKGRPIVACLGLKGPNAPLHFVVVVGAGEDAILLNDPARGKLVREEKDAFLRSWKVTGNWALLAVPRQAP
jgi:ABC-type bacteriocin/lantibiotic exporter with double-glycine peptidase domain